jgi:hypothetical protein
MKKIIILSVFCILSLQSSIAQVRLTERPSDEPRESFGDRLFFGGGFGLQFGTQTYIEVAPLVGYKLTDRLSTGISLKYIYYKFKDDIYDYSTHIYGGGPFTRFFIIPEAFLHAEFEILNLEVPDPLSNRYFRENITSVFLGGGYRQMIGDHSSLDLLLLYNINESRNSPYVNPVFRISFGLGI